MFNKLLDVTPENRSALELRDLVTNIKGLLDSYDRMNPRPHVIDNLPEDVVEAEQTVDLLRTVADEADALLESGVALPDGPSIVPDIGTMTQRLKEAYKNAKPHMIGQASGVGDPTEEWEK